MSPDTLQLTGRMAIAPTISTERKQSNYMRLVYVATKSWQVDALAVAFGVRCYNIMAGRGFTREILSTSCIEGP